MSQSQKKKNAPQVSTATLLAALNATAVEGVFNLTEAGKQVNLPIAKVKTRLKSIVGKLEEAADAEGVEPEQADKLRQIVDKIYAMPDMQDSRGRKKVSPADIAKQFGAMLGI